MNPRRWWLALWLVAAVTLVSGQVLRQDLDVVALVVGLVLSGSTLAFVVWLVHAALARDRDGERG